LISLVGREVSQVQKYLDGLAEAYSNGEDILPCDVFAMYYGMDFFSESTGIKRAIFCQILIFLFAFLPAETIAIAENLFFLHTLHQHCKNYSNCNVLACIFSYISALKKNSFMTNVI
jgi:hypothetical protein